MSTPELKECPFCGGKANFEPRRGKNDVTWIVRCNHRFLPNDDDILCPVNMRTHTCDSMDEAAKAWNTRIAEM